MDDFGQLDKMLDDIIKTMPTKKHELLENVGEILSVQVKQNIDSRINDLNSTLKSDVKVVLGSKGGYVAVKPSYENTHLNHLIENGHRIVKSGTVLGFINGVHMYRDSIEQCEQQILELAKNMVDEVIKND